MPIDHHRSEQWRHGNVLGEITPCSYVVQVQDRLVRRNRIRLRPSKRQVPCDPQPLPEQPAIANGTDV